jgi:hypothetical protein
MKRENPTFENLLPRPSTVEDTVSERFLFSLPGTVQTAVFAPCRLWPPSVKIAAVQLHSQAAAQASPDALPAQLVVATLAQPPQPAWCHHQHIEAYVSNPNFPSTNKEGSSIVRSNLLIETALLLLDNQQGFVNWRSKKNGHNISVIFLSPLHTMTSFCKYL